ncbi:MAG: hypothetical protein K6T29_06955 [Peptococcaceae bacterium]|nr:hypothetical protein [Peptococcaceae bacterium]
MGESGHNLRIAKSRLGSPRLPFEIKGVGNGYAAAGPVTVRKMTEEERARYGPPVPVQRFKPTKEEECGMESVREYIAYVDTGVEDDAGAAPEDTEPVESIEPTNPQSNNRLTREEYLRLKNEGLSDRKIMGLYGMKSTSEFYKQKKDWGLLGLRVSQQRPTGSQDQPKAAEALVSYELTIAQAMELRGDLHEDLHDLNRLFECVITSKRVIKLLSDYRDECRQKLARIEEVFARTTVRL